MKIDIFEMYVDTRLFLYTHSALKHKLSALGRRRWSPIRWYHLCLTWWWKRKLQRRMR